MCHKLEINTGTLFLTTLNTCHNGQVSILQSYFLLLFNTLLFDASLKGQPTLNGVIGWKIKFHLLEGESIIVNSAVRVTCLFLPI